MFLGQSSEDQTLLDLAYITVSQPVTKIFDFRIKVRNLQIGTMPLRAP